MRNVLNIRKIKVA